MNGTSGVSGLLFFSKERGFVFLLLPPECAGYIIKYTFYPVMVKTSTLLLRVGFDQQRTSFFLLVPRTSIVFKKNKKNREPKAYPEKDRFALFTSLRRLSLIFFRFFSV